MKACGIVLFRRFNSNVEYLLLQTSYGEHHWTPPKGFCEPDESELETAIRETYEESGLNHGTDYIFLDENNFKLEINYLVNSKQKTVIYWLGQVKDTNTKIILSNEHIDYKWLSLDQACQFAKYKEMIDVLNKCDNYINSK